MSKDTVRETVYSSEPRNTVDLCDATVEHYRWFSESNPDIVRSVSHGHWEPPPKGKELYVTFVDKDGNEDKVAVNEGDNLLTVAQANDIEMEGMSPKCHIDEANVPKSEDMFDKMPEADDEENDMLDLAFGLTETSRLGCQIIMKPELDGLVVKLPSTTRNMQASDFAKKKK
ncbi:related to electron transfer protein [Rhynchosporium agropyri]|uniref:Related to electron transfer protein n=2 Tax=Rhynchosporium TaxID=38037 RepID=A0A1E1M260_RHYSE|nr:related to electron transfer protein [Rhynchosporium agropyri]CZT43194.1 related to electron transfer protein [Rhynchosporium secalis]